MNSSITISEYRHALWKKGTAVSAFLCALLFLVFWNTSDPFWAGIFRLGAFVFFAMSVLGYLQLMDGPLNITLKTTDELLLVLYQKKDKTIHEEEFELRKISRVIPADTNQNLLDTILQSGAAALKVSFTDTKHDICLFEFGGRPLLFTPSDQTKITRFLSDTGIKKQEEQ